MESIIRRRLVACGFQKMCMPWDRAQLSSLGFRTSRHLVLQGKNSMLALYLSGSRRWFLCRAYCSCLAGGKPVFLEENSCVSSLDCEGVEGSEEMASSSASLESRQKQGKQISKSKLKKLHKQEQEKERKHLALNSFLEFYEQQYGSRWESLLNCLRSEPRFACLINKYATPPRATSVQHQIQFLKLAALESPERFPHPERDSKDLYGYYLLDAASLLVTEALELQGREKVLDLCAAPGGKTIGILQQLILPIASLTSNEPSEGRRQRLLKVICDYVPENLRHCVQATRRDGMRWDHSDQFDRVLVDAPCSSERHLLHDMKEMGTWTTKRTVNCAKRQLLLLSAALRSVKVGGIVVYSTCSISYQENDGVISKACKKLKTDFVLVRKDWQIGEPTEHGWIVLPDASQGWGPIYFAVLRKVCDTGLDTRLEEEESLEAEED